jgi:hypothetical protein
VSVELTLGDPGGLIGVRSYYQLELEGNELSGGPLSEIASFERERWRRPSGRPIDYMIITGWLDDVVVAQVTFADGESAEIVDDEGFTFSDGSVIPDPEAWFATLDDRENPIAWLRGDGTWEVEGMPDPAVAIVFSSRPS